MEGACLTACVTCVWAGLDSAWEQYKLEATLREMLAVGAADSPASSARFGGWWLSYVLIMLRLARKDAIAFGASNSSIFILIVIAHSSRLETLVSISMS